MYYNILPEDIKKSLRKEYYLRLFLTIFFSLSIVTVVCIFSLIPAFIQVFIKEKSLITQGEFRKESSKEETDNSSEILAVKEKIQIIGDVSNTNKKKDLINTIFSLKKETISISSLLYGREGDKSLITIKGVASTRSDLLLFRGALEKQKLFEKVDLPVSVLAKNTNVPFELKIQGSF